MLKFYKKIEDNKLKFAVIITKDIYDNWILCKHKKRNTLEFPGGRREVGETILETAKRELYEETGAIEFDIKELGAYSIEEKNEEKFGMLYFAVVKKINKIPCNSEMEKIIVLKSLESCEWTYPIIQSELLEFFRRISTKI